MLMLYHGPKGREVALHQANACGRVLGIFGDDGLKVDMAKEVVEVLSSAPIGDGVGAIVIGPVEDASEEAANALLKVLEEYGDGEYVKAFVWANDIGGVINTIRSRCIEEWCPGDGKITAEYPLLPAATVLCEAALRRKTAAVIEHLNEHSGREVLIARASVEVLAHKEEWPLKGRLILWESLREALVEPITVMKIRTAFLLE